MSSAASIQIKDQIIAKISPLTTIGVVYPAIQINPKQWPCVFVTTKREEGEFSSNAENSRVYEYHCTVMFPMGQDFVPAAQRDRLDYAERTVAEVIDQIINAVDDDYELDGSPVLFVNAADTEWGYSDYEGGVARAADVTLRVYTETTVV